MSAGNPFALTLSHSMREGTAITVSGFANSRPANSAAKHSKLAAEDSHSPIGLEGGWFSTIRDIG